MNINTALPDGTIVTLTPQLYKFLVDKGLLIEWKDELLEYLETELVTTASLYTDIDMSFAWDSTENGGDYWSEYHVEFLEEIEEPANPNRFKEVI